MVAVVAQDVVKMTEIIENLLGQLFLLPSKKQQAKLNLNVSNKKKSKKQNTSKFH